MITAQQIVNGVRAYTGLSNNLLAVMSNVALWKVRDISSGRVDISDCQDEVEAISYSAGFKFSDTEIVSLGDTNAISAARSLAEGRKLLGAGDAGPWVERWRRAGFVGEDGFNLLEVSLMAGMASKMSSRPDYRQVRSSLTWQQVARVLEDSNNNYVISGIGAAKGGLPSTAGMSRPVFYVQDVGGAISSIVGQPRDKKSQAISFLQLDSLPMDGARRDANGFVWASKMQGLVDAFGGQGRMSDQAEEIVATMGENKQLVFS
jgi:hypothetical protein